MNDHSELEVGYRVRPELQVRGLATEAAATCLEYTRSTLGAATLAALVHPDNVASQRVAERIGLRPAEQDTSGPVLRLVYRIRLGAVPA